MIDINTPLPYITSSGDVIDGRVVVQFIGPRGYRSVQPVTVTLDGEWFLCLGFRGDVLRALHLNQLCIMYWLDRLRPHTRRTVIISCTKTALLVRRCNVVTFGTQWHRFLDNDEQWDDVAFDLEDDWMVGWPGAMDDNDSDERVAVIPFTDENWTNVGAVLDNAWKSVRDLGIDVESEDGGSI